MAWLYLISAGLLEIVWAFAMKKSHGFTLLLPSLVTLVTMAASFALLALAMRSLPLGTAYSIWTGIGAVGAFIVGADYGTRASTVVLVGDDHVRFVERRFGPHGMRLGDTDRIIERR